MATECGCVTDIRDGSILHDTEACQCGHRIIHHQHKVRRRRCEVGGCECKELVRVPHPG